MNAPLPPEAKALLDAIAGGESGGRYDVMYGGGTFDPAQGHPRQAVPITTGPNAGKTSSAAGRYQFLGSTWDNVSKQHGLTDFSPQSQDMAAWFLADDTYGQRTGRDLQADLVAGKMAEIAKVLNDQWTSLPGGIEASADAPAFLARYTKALGATPQPGQRPLFSPQPVTPSVGPTRVATMAPSPTTIPGVPALANDPGNVFGNLANIFLQSQEQRTAEGEAESARKQALFGAPLL